MADFYFYAKHYFSFSFLNLGTQIRCPQNRYTYLKSAQDQPVYSLVSTKIAEILGKNMVM